jgi:hypothetical protein
MIFHVYYQNARSRYILCTAGCHMQRKSPGLRIQIEKQTARSFRPHYYSEFPDHCVGMRAAWRGRSRFYSLRSINTKKRFTRESYLALKGVTWLGCHFVVLRGSSADSAKWRRKHGLTSRAELFLVSQTNFETLSAIALPQPPDLFTFL